MTVPGVQNWCLNYQSSDNNSNQNNNSISSDPSNEINHDTPITNIFTGLQKTKITHLETQDIDARLPESSSINKLDDNVIDSVSQSLDSTPNITRGYRTKPKKGKTTNK